MVQFDIKTADHSRMMDLALVLTTLIMAGDWGGVVENANDLSMLASKFNSEPHPGPSISIEANPWAR